MGEATAASPAPETGAGSTRQEHVPRLPRIHAFELEDQPWLPRRLRDYATDFLQFMIDAGDSYAPVLPVIHDALATCGTTRVVDLGSGGGGPWLRLADRLRGHGVEVDVLLTDLYPSSAAAERLARRSAVGVRYHVEPVDATRVPAALTGVRTLFTALHHFRPADVRAILADAADSRQGFGAFEFSERSLRCVLMVVLSPLLVLLLTPFVRPFRWGRLFWTYVVPLTPLIVLFDGLVSCLRTYSAAELRALAGSVHAPDYEWRIGTAAGRSPVPVTYLVGVPAAVRSRERSSG